MLNERQLELLTAYVDGELNEAQRLQARKLQEQFPEARRLVEQLEQDADSLRRLPVPPLDRDLAPPILESIIRRPTIQPRRRAFSTASPFPAWAGLAAAAAVLLSLGAMTYLYFAAAFPGDQGEPIAHIQPNDDIKEEELPEAPEPVTPKRESPPAKDTRPEPRPESPSRLPAVAEKPLEKPETRPDRPIPPPLAAPSMEQFELKMVQIQPPTVLRLRELDQEHSRARLLAELGKEPFVRIELPCRNASRAFERVQSAGKEQMNFLVDQFAQTRLKNSHMRTHYAIYAEDLTAEELTHLLKQIAAEDTKAAKHPSDVNFDRIVITRLVNGERKELTDLLGFDPTQPFSNRPLGPLGTDPSKPLSDLTAAQVAEKLAGQGGSASSRSMTKLPGRNALVVSRYPQRGKSPSLEIKRFQDKRKPARPGTVQLLLVLHSTGP